uniref:Uncharacterized protein n=1 Tax=Otus sunia TaxID=257818 RepID=A0A8C8AP45_9STRI
HPLSLQAPGAHPEALAALGGTSNGPLPKAAAGTCWHPAGAKGLGATEQRADRPQSRERGSCSRRPKSSRGPRECPDTALRSHQPGTGAASREGAGMEARGEACQARQRAAPWGGSAGRVPVAQPRAGSTCRVCICFSSSV